MRRVTPRRCAFPLYLLVLFSVLLEAAVGAIQAAQVAGHHGRDIVGLCLSYGCSSTGQQVGNRMSNSTGSSCLNCTPAKNELPTKIEGFCMPREYTAFGGKHRTPNGWTTLATASWVSDSNELTKGSSMSAAPSKWNVHAQLAPQGPTGEDVPLDLAECQSRDNKVELFFVAFVGAPSEVANVGRKKKKRTFGDLTFEPISLQTKHFGKGFSGGQRGRHSGSLLKKTRFETNQGFAIVERAVIPLVESDTLYPNAGIFEVRATCGSGLCDVTDFHGCYHIMCRSITTKQLGDQLFEGDLKNQLVQAAAQRLEQKAAELENEKAKAAEELAHIRRELEQREKDAEAQGAAEFLRAEQEKARQQVNEEVIRQADHNFKLNQQKQQQQQQPFDPLAPPNGGIPLGYINLQGRQVAAPAQAAYQGESQSYGSFSSDGSFSGSYSSSSSSRSSSRGSSNSSRSRKRRRRSSRGSSRGGSSGSSGSGGSLESGVSNFPYDERDLLAQVSKNVWK